jgi:hypothetical protein
MMSSSDSNTMPANTDPLVIRVFFSHKYESFAVNQFFYRLLSKRGVQVQFEVDAGTIDGKRIPLNVTRVERKIRNADAFVGAYPLPVGAPHEPPVDYLREQSRYFRLELDMAYRMGLPAIAFSDQRYGRILNPAPSIISMSFDPREIPNWVPRRREDQFHEHIDRFVSRASGWIREKPQLTEDRTVGVFLGHSDYHQDAQEIIKRLLENRNWSPEFFAWPPQLQQFEYRRLEALDWVLMDCGQEAMASGLPTFLHARMIPTMRILRTRDPERRLHWPGSAGYTLFGGLDAGYGDAKKEVRWSENADLEVAP